MPRMIGLRGRPLLIFMVMTVVCPAYMLLGYNNAVVGGLLDLESFVNVFPETDTLNTEGPQKDTNALIQGTVVSLYLVGCMMGSLSCVKLGDIWGRLKTVFVGCIFTMIGSVVLSSSFSLGQLLAGRVLLGIGFGLISATVPVWQSECAPAKHRGALVVLEGVFVSAGLALSQFINLGLYFASGSVSWRFPIAFPIVFAVCMLCALPFQPDSPRWLVRKGRIEEAKVIMAAIYDEEENSERIQDDIRKMQLSLHEANKGSFRSLFTAKASEGLLLTRAFLAMFSTFSQQLNGIGIIGFYTAVIYSRLLGLEPVTSRILSACTYVFQFFCAFIVFYTIDRVGRRKLMMLGTIGMGLCFVALAPLIAHASDSKGCAGAATAVVFLFTLFFSVGALGINYLYGAEVAPLAHRTQIYSMSTVTLWTFNFLVVEVTPSGFSNLGYKYFIVFAATNLLLLTPVVYFFFPETRMRSLEDIDAIFLTAKNSLDVPKVSRQLPQISILELDDGGLKGTSSHADVVHNNGTTEIQEH